MDFSLTIKVFVLFTTCLTLIVDETQGGPIMEGYIVLRPREARRLNQILRNAGNFQIAPKSWDKRETDDEMSVPIKPIGTIDTHEEINDFNSTRLKPIGTKPPEIDELERRSLETASPSPIGYVPFYYYN